MSDQPPKTRPPYDAKAKRHYAMVRGFFILLALAGGACGAFGVVGLRGEAGAPGGWAAIAFLIGGALLAVFGITMAFMASVSERIHRDGFKTGPDRWGPL